MLTRSNDLAGTVLLHKRKKLSMGWKSTFSLCILALPGIIWFLIFSYIPMAGVVLAFKDFNFKLGIFGSPWCGLDNFKYLFYSNDAMRILRNTICYNMVFIAAGLVVSLSVAILLTQLKMKSSIKFYQSVYFMPYLVSWIVIGFISQGFFKLDGGIFNNLRESMGLRPISWYTETKPWPYIFPIMSVWKGFGYHTVLYYGALLGIDPTIYEAAKIDGANTRQRIFKITIPMIRQTIIVLFILSIGGIMHADFGLFYYIPKNSGPLFEVTDVLDTYIYRALKVAGDIPASSAAAFFQSIVGMILVVSVNAVVKKIDEESSLF